MTAPRTVSNGDAWKRTGLWSFLSALITSGSLIGYWQVNPPRPDPFTGVEGTELRREIEAKQHTLRRELINRLIKIEDNDKYIGQQQQELWKALATLPPERWQRRIEALEDWALRSGGEAYKKPE